MAKVQVYTMKNCRFCESAKKLLGQRSIPFETILLADDDDKAWTDLTSKSGMKTMPQIFHGDKLIGGFTELSELDKKNQLQELLA